MTIIPDDVVSYVFQFLSPQELARVNRVCTKWKQLGSNDRLWNAFDLKKIFPKLTIIDEKIWEKYIDLAVHQFTFEGLPPLNKRKLIPELIHMFALKIEKDAGITLLTLPHGLSLPKLRKSALSPKQGNPTGFLFIAPLVEKNQEKVVVEKTHRVAVTNFMLEDTKGLTANEHQQFAQKIGYKIPGFLTLNALNVLNRICSSEISRTHVSEPCPIPITLTRCLESDIVVGIEPFGLCASNGYDGDTGYPNVGISVMREVVD